jgi:hypothetical protein
MNTSVKTTSNPLFEFEQTNIKPLAPQVQNGRCASDELKNDKEVVLESLFLGVNILQFASDEIRNDKEIILKALQTDWSALEFASDELRNDKQFILEVLQQHGHRPLWFTSKELKNDKEFRRALVQLDFIVLNKILRFIQIVPNFREGR